MKKNFIFQFMVALALLCTTITIHAKTDDPPAPCPTQSQVFNRGLALSLYQSGSYVEGFTSYTDPVTQCCYGEIRVRNTDNILEEWNWAQTACCGDECDIDL